MPDAFQVWSASLLLKLFGCFVDVCRPVAEAQATKVGFQRWTPVDQSLDFRKGVVALVHAEFKGLVGGI